MDGQDERNSLINEARTRGLWIHCNYQNLWFSPSQLEKANKENRFCWGAMNFRVGDPYGELERLGRMIVKATEERDRFAAMIEHEKEAT